MSLTLLERPPLETVTVRPLPRFIPPRLREPKWMLPVSLAISLAFHAAALYLLRFSVTYEVAPVARPVIVELPVGAEILQIVPVTDGTITPEAAAPARAVPAALPQPVPGTTSPITAPPGLAGAAGRTETEVPPISVRIRGRETDARLWASPPERALPPVPSNAELARGRLYARLGTWNDSMLIAAEAAAKATDWTGTDANGNKWGISPGKLHLGSLTLPLPISFGPPPGRRDEYAARDRTWRESEIQYGRSIVRDDFKSQVRAIRARMDAKRDSTRRSGGGR
ncbi:MAG: hypothetical protein ACREL7_00805 [Longimicrobiales bacterium]